MTFLSKRRGRRRTGVVAGVVAAFSFVALAVAAPTSSPVGGFEIDANKGVPAVANNAATINNNAYYSGTDSPTGGDDWVDGGPNNGMFALSATAPHTAAADCYGSDIDRNAALL